MNQIQNCYQAFDFSEIGGIPRVIVSNRTSGGLSVDLLLNGIPNGSCIGIDVWVGKEAQPMFTSFGIYGDIDSQGNTTKFRLNITDPLLSCTPLTIRGWYTTNSKRSGYGQSYSSAGCNNLTPATTQLVSQAQTFNLANQSALLSLSRERMAYSKIEGSSVVVTNTNLPPQPSSPRLKVTDNKVQLILNVGDGTQSISKVYMLNPDLGFDLNNFLSATVIKNQAIFEFTLTSANAGTSTTAEIYSANAYGTSSAFIMPINLPEISKPGGGTKPSTPRDLKINFFPEKVEINVNLSADDLVRATGAYLIAPLLGYTKSTPLFATIAGSKATFEIALTQLILGKASGLQIYSTNENGDSEALDGVVTVPNVPNPSTTKSPTTNTSTSKLVTTKTSQTVIPSAPKNPKYKLSGSNVVITVDVPAKANGDAKSAYLVAPGIGLTKSAALVGKVTGGVATFVLPIQDNMAGKTTLVAVYAANSAGLSDPLSGKVTIPNSIKAVGSAEAQSNLKTAPLPSKVATPVKAAAIATTKKANKVPVVQKPKTVKCYKGKTSRIFTATTCPAGWTK